MFSFYIYKIESCTPDILAIAMIDNIEEVKIDSMIDDIITSLLENKYLSLKNNIIFCIIDRKLEKKHFFVNQGSDSEKYNKLTLNYLEEWSFDIITNYKSSYLLEFNKLESSIVLKEIENNMYFLGNFW